MMIIKGWSCLVSFALLIIYVDGTKNNNGRQKSSFRVDCPEKCLCSEEFQLLSCQKLYPKEFRDIAWRTEKVKIFSATNSDIKYLQNHTLDKYKTTSELEISRSGLRGIEKGALLELPDLVKLDLSSNRINIVGDPVSFYDRYFNYAIAYLPTFLTSNILRHVDLSHNNIKYISSAELRGLKFVQLLNISNNNIPSVDSSYGHLLGIKVLDMSYNRITEVDANFGKRQLLLEDLDFSHNSIALLPSLTSFSCSNLIRVDLSYNELSHIALAGVFDCQALETLNLNHNKITKIRRSDLKNNAELKVLNIASNAIAKIEDHSFKSNSKIEELYASDNSLDRLKGSTLSDLDKLSILDLSRNKISTVNEKAFSKNVWLNYIFLQKNLITYIYPNTFANLRILRIVDLSNNLLTVPFAEWFIVPSGEFFFNKTSQEVEERTKNSSTTFRMKENKWICNCEAKNFHQWLKSQKVIEGQNSVPSVKCYLPYSHRGENLLDINLICDI